MPTADLNNAICEYFEREGTLKSVIKTLVHDAIQNLQQTMDCELNESYVKDEIKSLVGAMYDGIARRLELQACPGYDGVSNFDDGSQDRNKFKTRLLSYFMVTGEVQVG